MACSTWSDRQEPGLNLDAIETMRDALQVAATCGGSYVALPDAVRNRCLDLCFALDEQGDRRLIGILEAAEKESRLFSRLWARPPRRGKSHTPKSRN
jgi:hypothetical protein